MSRVPLVYGGCDYWDRTRPLIDGRVEPEGIDLTFVPLDASDLGRRGIYAAEFEAAEMYSVSYMVMRSRGDDRFVGLPVFPSRSFRHNNVFVRSDAGIERPQDLRGKRIGVLQYSNTASMWARAMLHHDYAVAPASVHWIEGGFVLPGTRHGHADVELPPEIRVTRNEDEPLEDMLLAGKLDALIHTSRPRAFTAGDPRVRRLFPDFRDAEREYFCRTGFFPIMHMVVLRRDVYDRHRWMANSLIDAFKQAKLLTWPRLQDTGALAVPLPWLRADLEEVASLFGGDPFPYGFEANRLTLEAMTQYLLEQGMTTQKLAPEDLFARETLADGAG